MNKSQGNDYIIERNNNDISINKTNENMQKEYEEKINGKTPEEIEKIDEEIMQRKSILSIRKKNIL